MEVLAVTLGSGDLFHFPLAPGLSTVGRAEANLIRLQDETVSSAHAELVEIAPGKYCLRDLGSTNGTFVNGSAVSETEIFTPCSVTFGSVRCQLASSSAPDSPRPSVGTTEEQRAIDALTKENDELRLARADLAETLERTRGEAASQRDASEQLGKQAAGEAQRETATLKQALDATMTKLALQEQEHKQELTTAHEAERKEREKLDCNHAAQLTKLKADGEANRLRAQELLAQNAKAGEEIEQLTKLAEQSKKTVAEKHQALCDAQSETDSLKKTLHDLNTRLASREEDFKQEQEAADARQKAELDIQAQEHKRELIAAIEAERKVREKVDGEHAVRLMKLEAESETDRLRAQELLSQIAKAREEIEQLAAIAEKANKAVAQKEQALRDAESETGALKKALHDLNMRLVSQEEDFKRKLEAADAGQKEEGDHLNPLEASQLTEQQILNEAEQRQAQELQDQLEALRKKHPRAIQRLESIQDADLVTTSSGREKPLAEPSGQDPTFAGPRLRSESPSSGKDDPLQAKQVRPPSSDQSAASAPQKLKRILSALPKIVRRQSAAKVTTYVLTFVFGYLLSTAWPKREGHQPPKPGVRAREATAIGIIVAVTPSTPATEPGAPLLASVNTEQTEAFQKAANPVSSERVTIPSPLPELADEGRGASQIPPWLVEYQFAAACLAHGVGANPLLLLGAQWHTAVEPPEATAGVNDLAANSEQSTLESSRLLSESETNGAGSENLGSDSQRSDITNSNATAETANPTLPSSTTELGLNLKPLAGIPDNIGTDHVDLASLSRPSVDHQLQKDQVTTGDNSPKATAATASTPLTVMILGDSMSLCGFGKRLDDQLRVHPQVRNTFTYMASGTNPLSWLKEKPYTNAKTRSGFWSIETAQGKEDPKVTRDTYGMRRGSTPKSHQVPKLEDLLATNRPDILIVQNGTNLFDLFRDGRTVQPQRQGPLLKHYIEPFITKVLGPASSVRKIYWISSPTSGRVSKEIQDFVFEQICLLGGEAITVIDSRQLISYPYRNMAPDREHFIGKDMDQWADKVYEVIQKDLASQSLATLKLLHALPPGAGADQSNSINGKAKEADLYVRATLTFKSEPLKVKALLPYQDSLVAYVYSVRQVVEGEYAEKNILVMHPAHIGLKIQSLKNHQIGKTYNLRLRELETTQWSTVKSKDDSGAIDLTPYIQVEDDLKILEHGHGAVSEAH